MIKTVNWPTGYQLNLKLGKFRMRLWKIYGEHNPNRHACGVSFDWR